MYATCNLPDTVHLINCARMHTYNALLMLHILHKRMYLRACRRRCAHANHIRVFPNCAETVKQYRICCSICQNENNPLKRLLREALMEANHFPLTTRMPDAEYQANWKRTV